MALGQLVALAGGSQRLDLPTVRGQMAAAEAALPEGSPVQLDLAFSAVSLPLIGRINLAAAAAGALNQAAGAGSFTVRGEGIRPWSGGAPIASASADGSTLHLRWLHAQSFGALLLVFFLGVAVAGLLLYLYVHHWSLFGAPGTSPASIWGLPPVEFGIIAAALVLGPVLLRGP